MSGFSPVVLVKAVRFFALDETGRELLLLFSAEKYEEKIISLE